MKIALFGAGTLGRRIAVEALDRGHAVTVIVRDPARLDLTRDGLTVTAGDVRDPSGVARAAADHDAVISAVGPDRGGGGAGPGMLSEAARALLEGLPQAGVRRLIVVGGAGSLEVVSGAQLMDTPDFNPAWRPTAQAHRDALQVYRDAGTNAVDWTYVSPAGFIEPGSRTGHYRTGGDRLVTDDQGRSYITAEDFAVALLDELERPRFTGRRFTAAY